MFIEQNINKENPFWKYLIGTLIIVIASIIGQIPLSVVVLVKSLKNGKIPSTEAEMMKALGSNLFLFLMLLSFAFTLLGIYLVVKYLHKQTFLSVTTSRKNVDWKRVFFSFSIWAIFSSATILIQYYLAPEELVWNFKPIPFAILFVISVLLIPLQTSAEEYLFRGYLMQGIADLARNKWIPLVITSVTFGALHFANPEVDKMGNILLLYYIGTGFFLGIITLMDEGMELSLGFHAANNLIGALLVTTDWSALQTNSIFKDVSEPSAGFEIITPVIIIFPIILFIFSKKYNWTNWKEKLTGKIEEPITNIEITTENEY